MLNGELIGTRGLSGEIQREVISGGSGSGTSDYPELNDLPQINGVELVGNKTSEELGLVGNEELADYVKFTNYASNDKAGVVKAWDVGGIGINSSNGNIYLSSANNQAITNRTPARAPITVENMDFAVKTCVTTNKETLTDEEKAKAQSWLGVDNNFVAKPTDTSGFNRIYGTNATNQTMMFNAQYPNYSYTENNKGSRNGVPVMSNGNIGCSTPIDDYHTTNKKYVDDKFNGANKAVSFENYSEMITSLNALPADSYSVGQNIMIVTLAVPDLWVSEIAEESVAYTYVSDDDFVNQLTTNGSVQVGYYKLSALETQKVDLSEYTSSEDFNKLVNNETYIKSKSDNSFRLGGASAGPNSVAIGASADSYGQYYCTNIGYLSKSTNQYGIGIGYYAQSKADKAIQIGTGTNSIANSLQIKGDNIYKIDTHTLTVQNIELNGVDLGTQLGDLNTALETILGV